MSSPIHHDKSVDSALVYVPRRAREQAQQVSTLPAAPQLELPAGSFSGDRGMLESQHAQLRAEMLERQHALMGNFRRQVRRGSPYALLICSFVGIAVAAGVWAWMPGASLSVSLGNDDRFPSVATRPEQPNRQVDVVARATLEQEPASSPDRSEPASFAATMTQPPPAQVPVPAPVVATSEPTPQQTAWDLVRQRRLADQRAILADQRAMRERKSTQEPASSPDRSEPASFAATMTQPPPAQVPVPAPVVATREPTPQQTVPDFVTRHLDADELASMLRRADDLIKSGDLSSARLLLRRVAEAIATVQKPPAPADTTEPEEPPGTLEGAVVPSIALAPSAATGAAARGDVAGNIENAPTPSLPGSGVAVAKVTADTRAAIDRADVKTTADKLKESKGVKPPGQNQNRDMAGALSVTCQTSGPAGGGHWAWRLIDGRKCWYKGAAGMDKSLLHWLH